jgi:hypothetical protein
LRPTNTSLTESLTMRDHPVYDAVIHVRIAKYHLDRFRKECARKGVSMGQMIRNHIDALMIEKEDALVDVEPDGWKPRSVTRSQSGDGKPTGAKGITDLDLSRAWDDTAVPIFDPPPQSERITTAAHALGCSNNNVRRRLQRLGTITKGTRKK